MIRDIKDSSWGPMNNFIPRCPFVSDATDLTALVDSAFHGEGVPHGVWARLRRDSPVASHALPDGRTFWSVASYRDVDAVLRDTLTFTSQRGTLLDQLGTDDPAAGIQLVATDPPRHATLRMPLQRSLAAKRIAAMRGRLRVVTRELLAPLADGGPYDLADHMRRLSMAVMGILMDLPPGDWPRLAALSFAAIAPEDPIFGQPGSAESALRAAHRELFAYFRDIARRRRDRPGDDLVSLLTRTRWDDRPLNQGEVVANCYSLLVGGAVTTSQVPATTLADFMGTATLAQWAAAPHLLAGGVEEALRWATPTMNLLRYAVTDTVLGGYRIRAGDAVVTWLASANRDADVFPDPFTFDIRRQPNKHLTFGIGAHYCVGNSIVRATLGLVFAELFSHFTDLAPAGPGTRLRSNTISGWVTLPMTAQTRS
ncbi:cytochrome P450 [Nonomuraea monospora]